MVSDLPEVPPVDLRQALYFLTVARELSFSRAAQRLHISTPALSQQVKVLERHLGVQLLIRDTRRVRLTDAGSVFALACQRLLEDGELAVLQARQAAGLVNGRLLLAALHEAEPAFEPFLNEFHAVYPGVQVQVATLRHAELLTAVRNGTADAALTWSFLLHGASNTEGLHWFGVAPTEVFAALDPKNPLADHDRVPRGEPLRGSPVVLFERGYSPATYDYAVAQLYGPDYADPPVQEISVTVRAQEAMARHIAATGALAPLSRPVADLMRDTWVIRPFEPPWMMDGCIVWQRDNSSAALIAFMTAAGAVGVHPRSRTRMSPAPLEP